jgi:hypothetical protein
VGFIGLTDHAAVNTPRHYQAPITGLERIEGLAASQSSPNCSMSPSRVVRSGMRHLHRRCEDALTIVSI